MKIIKFFLLLSAVISICYFSWSYYISRSLQEEHKKAKLVLEEHCNKIKISGLERFYVYKQEV